MRMLDREAQFETVAHFTRSRQNAEMLSELYDAFASGNEDAAGRFAAPDFVLHVPGRGRNAGEYWGAKGLQQFMSNIAAQHGGLFDLRVPVLSVNGGDAFTRDLVRMNRAHDPDLEWTIPISNRFKIRDRKLAEAWVIPEDQRLYDEYWTPGGEPVSATLVKPRTRNLGPLVDVRGASSPENLLLLEGMYESFWRGDGDGMRRHISEDVVVNIAGKSAMSGVYIGWSGYMDFRAKLMSMVASRYKLDVVAIAASERDAWATEYIRMNRPWDDWVRAIEVQMHFRIEGGLITQIDDFPVDTYAWEKLYTPPRP